MSNFSPEELRIIGRGMMSDPEMRRAIISEILGPMMGVRGGTCSTPATEVSHGQFGNDCSDTGDYTFSGNVGIGTTSPTFEWGGGLEIDNSAGASLNLGGNAFGNGTTLGRVLFSRSGAPGDSMAIMGSTQVGTSGGTLDFSTQPDGGAVALTMRIDSVGNVGIGTSTPACPLDVAGPMRFGSYSSGTLPSPGVAGRIVRLTDNSQDIWMDTGAQWVSICGNMFDVKVLGALGDGSTDDTTAIQNAINAAAAVGGGIVVVPPGVYLISSSITIGQGVKVRGAGGAAGQTAGGSGASASTFKWASGAGAGTMIHVAPASANTQLQDIEISDLLLNGNGVAQNALILDRVSGSKFLNLNVQNMSTTSSTGLTLTVTTATTANIDTDFNLFENCTISGVTTGLVLDGREPTYAVNATHNTFVGLSIVYTPVYSSGSTTDAGILLKSSDNNSFHAVSIFNAGSPPFSPDYSSVVITDPALARSNYFYHLEAATGVAVKSTSGGHPKNFIFGIDLANGQPEPIAVSGSTITSTTNFNDASPYLYWVDSNGALGGGLSSAKSGSGSGQTTVNLPLTFSTAQTERARIDTSGRLLLNLASSDVSGTGILAENFVAAVSAATNASVLSLGSVAGSFTAIGSNRTGSGTFLPMAFFTDNAERLRIESSSPHSARFSSNVTAMSDATYNIGETSTRWANIYSDYMDALNAFNVNGTQVVTSRQAAVADVSETAGSSYGSNEQNMLNDLKSQLNALLARLRTHGLIS